MKYNRIFLSILTCISANNYCIRATESAHIINDTDHTVRVDFGVPEHRRADIHISKINDLQDALHKAILNDSSIEIRKAVQAGADVNKPKDGKSPLLWSILLRRYNAVAELIQLGSTSDDACAEHVVKMKDIKSLLMLVKQGQVKFDIQKVKGIIQQSVTLKKNSSIALELIKELVSRGCNVNEFWHAVITLAYYKPSEGEDAVRFLLFRGANPNHIDTSSGGRFETPLCFAAVYHPNKQIVKLLIDAGADIHKKIKPYPRGNLISILSYVIERGSSLPKKRQEVIELLLEHGASL